MDKQQTLDELLADIQAFENPKKRNAGPKLVFGEGDSEAKIMFIGEAPGFYEAQQGRPFVGAAGKLLDKMIESIGLKREDVYITNVLRFRPQDNRDPLPDEVAEYAPFLTRHIAIIEPKVIITLGRFAMNYFLPDAKITRDHGKLFRIDGQLVFPVFHPAAALRDSQRLKDLETDITKIPKLLAIAERKAHNWLVNYNILDLPVILNQTQNGYNNLVKEPLEL